MNTGADRKVLAFFWRWSLDPKDLYQLCNFFGSLTNSFKQSISRSERATTTLILIEYESSVQLFIVPREYMKTQRLLSPRSSLLNISSIETQQRAMHSPRLLASTTQDSIRINRQACLGRQPQHNKNADPGQNPKEHSCVHAHCEAGGGADKRRCWPRG